MVLAILARVLTPADFGVVAADMIVVGLAELFSFSGVAAALVQLKEVRGEHVSVAYLVSLSLGAFLCLATLLAAQTATNWLGIDSPATLKALALLFPIQALSVVSFNLLQREMSYRTLAGVEFVSFLIGYGVVSVSLSYLGFGVWALVLGILAQAALSACFLVAAQPYAILARPSLRALREMAVFGAGLSLAKGFNYLARKGDNLVVARFLGPVPLGLYSRAYSLMDASNSLFTVAANKVLFPVFSRAQGDFDRLARGYRTGLSLLFLIFAPASLVALVVAPEVVELILGSQWFEVIVPLRVLLIGVVFRVGQKLGAILAHATGAVYESAWRQLVYAICVVGGALLCVDWGIAGVAAATTGALAMQFCMMTQLAMRTTDLGLAEVLRSIAPGLAVATLVASLAWLVATHFRTTGASSAVVLSVVGLVSGGLHLAIVSRLPARAIGSDVVALRADLRRFVARALGTE